MGIETVVVEENTLEPIVVTEVGIVTEVREVHEEKTHEPKKATEVGMVTEMKEVHE